MHESLSAFKKKINQKLCTLVNQYVCSQKFSVNLTVSFFYNDIETIFIYHIPFKKSFLQIADHKQLFFTPIDVLPITCILYYRRNRPISRTCRPPTGSVTLSSRTRPITVARAGTRGRTRAGCTPTPTTSARWCSPPTPSPRPSPEAPGGQRPAVYIYHCK